MSRVNTIQTSQELQMLSSVTINCQVTSIVMVSGGHHQKSRRRGSLSQRFSTRMEVPSVLLSTAIWRVVRRNLAGGAKRGLEVEAGERVCGQGGSLSKIHDFIHLRIQMAVGCLSEMESTASCQPGEKGVRYPEKRWRGGGESKEDSVSMPLRGIFFKNDFLGD